MSDEIVRLMKIHVYGDYNTANNVIYMNYMNLSPNLQRLKTVLELSSNYKSYSSRLILHLQILLSSIKKLIDKVYKSIQSINIIDVNSVLIRYHLAQ